MSEQLPDLGRVKATLFRLVQGRGPQKSVCPSEVARALEPGDWRPLMPLVRQAAAELAQQGLVQVTQEGKEVDPLAAKGPVRVRIKP